MTENNETTVQSETETELTENTDTSETEGVGTDDSTTNIDIEPFDDSDILDSLNGITEILETMAADTDVTNEQYIEMMQTVSADIQQLNTNVVGASDRLLFLICIALCGAIWLILRNVYRFFDMFF